MKRKKNIHKNMLFLRQALIFVRGIWFIRRKCDRKLRSIQKKKEIRYDAKSKSKIQHIK